MSNRVSKLLTTRKTEAYALVALAFIIPVIALAGVGAYFLIGVGLFIPILLVLSLFLFGISLFFALKRKVVVPEADPAQDLTPRPDWSPHDESIWKEAIARIDAGDLYNTQWSELPQVLMTQVSFVASRYHGKSKQAEYEVTLPALLLMLETCAREYRKLILETVPLSQEITVSNMRLVYENQEHIQKGSKLIGFAWSLWRLKTNPLNAIAQELSSASDKSVLGALTDHMQNNLKRMLLQEVSQVSIDLYSGRLKISDQELLEIQAKKGETLELATARPLTVVIVGQVNSGKSSLVNAIARKCVSETDIIPCSDSITRHRLTLQNDIEVDLLDTPGIDGDPATNKALLDVATGADLVLWLSQSNQPAKKLDAELVRLWKLFFETHQDRRAPPLVLVTSHNDMLQPGQGWNPPYDLTDTGDPKVRVMLDAIQYTRESLELDPDNSAVPICVAPDKAEYNLQTLLTLIVGMSEKARATQLNRDRIEAKDNRSLYEQVWGPLVGMGKVAGQVLVSRI